jgi:hypothetical protein
MLLSIILTCPINLLLQFLELTSLVEAQHAEEPFRREIEVFETGRVRGA